MFYILEGKSIRKVEHNEYMEWRIFNTHVVIKQDDLPNHIFVSTVFFGIATAGSRVGKPLLFETMIFGGEHDRYCERYATWEEAEAGHQRAIELIYNV